MGAQQHIFGGNSLSSVIYFCVFVLCVCVCASVSVWLDRLVVLRSDSLHGRSAAGISGRRSNI